MITINCADDLKQVGFECLTGEACGLSMRLLYDVTQQGKESLERFLDVAKIELKPAWNGGDAVGSVMLTNDTIIPLGAFCLLHQKKCVEVWQEYNDKGYLSQSVYGWESHEEIEESLCLMGNTHYRRWGFSGTAGDRNTHMMSGRTS